MNRRAFLGILGAFVADPERALFVPGRKLISIPKLPVTLLTAGWVKECGVFKIGDRIVLSANFDLDRRAQEIVRQYREYVVTAVVREGLDPQVKELR